MKIIIGLVALFAMSTLSAGEIKLQKVSAIGVVKHKVIFQSSDVKFVKKSNIVRGKIVSKWGTNVFEVGTAYYLCNEKNFCKFVDYDRVAMFESCIVKNNKVACSKKITADSSGVTNDVNASENPDAVSDSFESVNDDLNEFPARIQDEYSDLF